MIPPVARELKSARFRRDREQDWKRLERLLGRLETGSAAKLTDDELIAVPVLYRAALSSLSVARETSLDKALLDYLESLCARAYFVVYGARPNLRARAARFFLVDWPAAARALWRETLLSAAITLLGTLVAFWMFRQDADWFYSFIPRELAQGRDPSASTAALKAVLYDGGGARGPTLASFAAYLFTHNAQIAIFAFALGFAFGIPTAFLLLTNGLTLGALFGLYVSHGLGVSLGGWIFIHGVTELFAVVLAGAAGFRIGWSLAFPGDNSRVDAAAAAGRQAATLMAGVVIMLIVAGLLEGVGRQTITSDLARYGVAAASAVLWGLYFYAPRRGRP